MDSLLDSSGGEKREKINYSDISQSNLGTEGEANTSLLKKAGLADSQGHVKEGIYPQYPSRFIALIGFGLGSAMNGIVWISLVAVTDEVKQAFNVTDFFLNMCSFVFMIFYIPCNFLANYIHENIGPRYGIMVGVIFTCVGAWFKIFCNVDFKAFVMIGNCLAAFAQPFFLNAPALITNTWFSEKSRTAATSIAGLSNSMGTAFGMIFPTLFVTAAKDDDHKTIQDNRDGIRLNLIIQAGMATCIMLFNVLLVKNKPPKPPSASASAERQPFLASLKALAKDLQFLKLMVCYACMNAIFGNVATLIGELTEKYGFNASQRGIFGMTYLLGGVVGANIMGYILAKTKWYKILSAVIPLTTVGSIAVFYFTLGIEEFAVTILASFLIGSTILPAIPVCYEYAAEITFPVGEASSSGTMMLCGQLLSFTLGLINSAVLNTFEHRSPPDPKKGGFFCLSILAGVALVGFVAALLVKPKFKRDRRESQLPTPNTVRKIIDFKPSELTRDEDGTLYYEPSDS